jgi:hypothetical protein
LHGAAARSRRLTLLGLRVGLRLCRWSLAGWLLHPTGRALPGRRRLAPTRATDAHAECGNGLAVDVTRYLQAVLTLEGRQRHDRTLAKDAVGRTNIEALRVERDLQLSDFILAQAEGPGSADLRAG